MKNIYKSLNMKVGLANSVYLNKVWKMLCTKEELELADILPGTIPNISSKSGKSEEETESILTSLFKKGAAFKSKRDNIVVYKLPKNIIQFHDACLLWDGADQEFYDTWKKIMDEEFSTMMRNLPKDVKL